MEFTCIRICETGIVVTRDNEVLDSSPGIAILRENQIITGFEAASQQYYLPQFTYNRFWKNLNQKPLANRNKNIRHNADLAYAHLRDITKRVGKMTSVVIAVPSDYTESELSLLAGIFEALKIKISAIIDKNVASLSSWAPSGEHCIIEAYPHHLSISKLKIDSKINLEEVDVMENIGWINFHQKISDYVANVFLQQTRFFPFHDAESEKMLNDQVPEIIRLSNIASTFEISLLHKEIPHTVRLNSASIAGLLEEQMNLIFQILPVKNSNLLVSELVSSLPGLNTIFPEYAILDNRSCEDGITQNAETMFSKKNTLSFIENLPNCSTPMPNSTVLSNAEKDHPTHLLTGDFALPISESPLLLGYNLQKPTNKNNDSVAEVLLFDKIPIIKPNGDDVSLNNKTITSESTLSIGDSVILFPSGIKYKAIQVTKNNAI